MTDPLSHALIPTDLISSGSERKSPPTDLEIINSRRPLYLDFQPLGVTSNPESLGDAFWILPSDDGTLYISRKTFLEDLEGNQVPRALFITQKGKTLIKQNPGILKKIDMQESAERSSKAETVWTKGSFSAEVKIMELEDGSTIAVKRFKRYKDGRKLRVGGLEQADAHLKLNKIFANNPDIPCRLPDIYFASQDVVVMENIENMRGLAEFIEDHPEAEETVWQEIELIDRVIADAFEDGELKGNYERLLKKDSLTGFVIRAVAYKHLFVQAYDSISGRVSFVMIDPNV